MMDHPHLRSVADKKTGLAHSARGAEKRRWIDDDDLAEARETGGGSMMTILCAIQPNPLVPRWLATRAISPLPRPGFAAASVRSHGPAVTCAGREDDAAGPLDDC